MSIDDGEPISTCSRCGASGTALTTFITRSSNRNGNAGRPFLKCAPCKKFVTFTDERGIKDDHPLCKCGKPSRMQVAGVRKGRELHLKCGKGACGLWAEVVDEVGEVARLTEELVERLKGVVI